MRNLIRICLTLLLGAVLILCLAPAACAESGKWGGLDWNLKTDGQLSITGSGPMDDLGANDAWRQNKAKISSVVIGKNVTSIGANAFASCANITSVTIPGNVTTIGDSAFSDCTGLKEAVIADGVTDIGDSAFFACGWMKTVTIPGSVETIGEGAFFGCDSLSDVYYTGVPEEWGAILIEDANDELSGAARHCIFGRGVWGGLNWVLDREGLLSITGSGAVDDFSYNSVEAWRGYVTEVVRAEIGEGVTSIGVNAFGQCFYMTSAALPKSLRTIGESAFAICSSLESITIPSGVKTIGRDAFYSCLSLPTVTVPANVTSIGERAFGNCECLTEIRVQSGNMVYCDVNGVLFDKNVTTVLQYPRGGAGEYALPDTVGTIGPFAFESCVNLTGISLPTGLTSIGRYAFCSCGALTGISLPAGLTSIEERAFKYSGLTSVTIPGGVTKIMDETFQKCQSLRTVMILDGVTKIGFDAFEGCASLENASIPATLKDVYEGAFYHCDSLSVIYFGGTQAQWNKILTEMGPANGPLKNATVYYGASPDLILPEGLITIGPEAFRGGAFTYVRLSENTKTISRNAFADCPNLRYIYIPEATKSISAMAFGSMTGLTIYGKAGSAAETFANQKGFTFIAV